MKKIETIIIVLFSCFVYSQNNAYEIEFSGKVTFENPADSLRFVKTFGSLESEFKELFLTPEKQLVSIKSDTILLESFPKKEDLSKAIFIRTPKGNERLDLVSGKKTKWNNHYVTAKYRSLKNYQRIPNEDMKIIEKPCEAWISKSKNGWNKIWISKINLVNPQLEYTDLIIDGYLVLKTTKYVKDGRIINFEAKSIKTREKENFKNLLNKHLVVDIKSKYLPIIENAELPKTPIKKGVSISNYKFRNVFKDELIELYDITAAKKYTIIEFWGTWCVPCLLANKKIKELKELFDDKLSILSINAKDRNIEKLKKVIEKKQMNWQHGYSTDKILEVFNKKGVYPRLVVLNNENKVLFVGNPQVDLEEIKSVLNK